ncbi:methyltransferase, partial [Streptomyces sp. NPDC002920]
MTSTPTHTLAAPQVGAAIDHLFEQAGRDDAVAARVSAELPGGFGHLSPQARADAAAEIYMPISAAGGE